MSKNIHYLIAFFVLFLFCSCDSKTPDINLSVYRAFSKSLAQSNYRIEQQIQSLQKAIERDTSDSRSSYNAKKWQFKALQIQTNSNEIFTYIDSLKIALKIEAGLKLIDMKENWEENNFKAVENIFQKKEKAEELEKRILEYESKVFAVDRSMDSIFRPSVNHIIMLTDIRQVEEKTFAKTFFTCIPTIAAFGMLQKFENDIKNFEIQLITYCYNQIPRYGRID